MDELTHYRGPIFSDDIEYLGLGHETTGCAKEFSIFGSELSKKLCIFELFRDWMESRCFGIDWGSSAIEELKEKVRKIGRELTKI